MRPEYAYYDENGKPMMFVINDETGYHFVKLSDMGEDMKKYIREQKTKKYFNNPRTMEKLLPLFMKLHLENFHTDATEFIDLHFEKEEAEKLNEFCLNHDLIDGNGITANGIKLLETLQNEHVLKNQYSLNKILVIATIISSIIALLALFKP
jgi:hypothetical protein